VRLICNRGIVRTLASNWLSSIVGGWIDSSSGRLKTLISTITINRLSVIIACILWVFTIEPVHDEDAFDERQLGRVSIASILNGDIFSLILILEILEALSAPGIMTYMERDWVVTASSPNSKPYNLTISFFIDRDHLEPQSLLP
jgi:solute carrier family 40 (iron-regulated transporter), member 1